ncbi:hypothetical protein KUL49_13200 [Alteromonas sp. KUL49]|nr:hypothetical protein KUL49_13200 [Alteromonas sp. KUL49]
MQRYLRLDALIVVICKVLIENNDGKTTNQETDLYIALRSVSKSEAFCCAYAYFTCGCRFTGHK